MPLRWGAMSFGLKEKNFSTIIDEPTARTLVSLPDNIVYPTHLPTKPVHGIHSLCLFAVGLSMWFRLASNYALSSLVSKELGLRACDTTSYQYQLWVPH